MTSTNMENTESVNNENYNDNINTKENIVPLEPVQGVICNNDDVSYPCESTNGTSSTSCHPEDTGNINDAERYTVITSDIFDYDSYGSSTSSVSHTSADSSEGYTVSILYGACPYVIQVYFLNGQE